MYVILSGAAANALTAAAARSEVPSGCVRGFASPRSCVRQPEKSSPYLSPKKRCIKLMIDLETAMPESVVLHANIMALFVPISSE